MHAQHMKIAVPQGAQTTPGVHQPVTLVTIEMLEEASGVMFSALRRNALRSQTQDAGAIEYDSWFANLKRIRQ